MDCKEVRELWNNAIDGWEDTSRRNEMKAHIESCPECRRYKAQMTDILGALGSLRLESEVRPKPKLYLRQTIGLWIKIAAGFIIVLGTTLFLASRQSPRQTVNTSTTAHNPISQTTITLKQESAKTLLAVQYKTDNPKVHLFVFYPTARAIPAEKKINQNIPF